MADTTTQSKPRGRGRPPKSTASPASSTQPAVTPHRQTPAKFQPIIKTRAQRFIESGGEDGRPAPSVTPKSMKAKLKSKSPRIPTPTATRQNKKVKTQPTEPTSIPEDCHLDMSTKNSSPSSCKKKPSKVLSATTKVSSPSACKNKPSMLLSTTPNVSSKTDTSIDTNTPSTPKSSKTKASSTKSLTVTPKRQSAPEHAAADIQGAHGKLMSPSMVVTVKTSTLPLHQTAPVSYTPDIEKPIKVEPVSDSSTFVNEADVSQKSGVHAEASPALKSAGDENLENIDIGQIYSSAAAVLSPKLLDLLPGSQSVSVTLRQAAEMWGAELLGNSKQYIVQGPWPALELLLQDLSQYVPRKVNPSKGQKDKVEVDSDLTAGETAESSSQSMPGPVTYLLETLPEGATDDLVLIQADDAENTVLLEPEGDDLAGQGEVEKVFGAEIFGSDVQDDIEMMIVEEEELLPKTSSKKRRKPRPTNTVCPTCGFTSSSILGLQQHMVCYHGEKTHECDVCFSAFGFKYMRDRHRVHHFNKDGMLKESGIVVHRLHRERLGRQENLSPELRETIQLYEIAHNLQPIEVTAKEDGKENGKMVEELMEVALTETAESDEGRQVRKTEVETEVPRKDGEVMELVEGTLTESVQTDEGHEVAKTDVEMLLSQLEAMPDGNAGNSGAPLRETEAPEPVAQSKNDAEAVTEGAQSTGTEPGNQDNQSTGEEKTADQLNQSAIEEKTADQLNQSAGEEKTADLLNQSAGDEKITDQLNQSAGEEKTADQLNQSAGKETADQLNQSTGDEKAADQLNQSTGDEKTADQLNQSAGEEKTADQLNQSAGEEKAAEEPLAEIPPGKDDLDTSQSTAVTETPRGRPVHRCHVCSMCYITKSALQRHIGIKHTEGVAPKKGKMAASVRRQLQKQVTDADILECPHCDKVCYRIQNFTRHLQSHGNPEFFACELCEYKHRQRGEVMRHMRNAHNEKTFICDQCPLRVRTRALLNAHIKYKHEHGCVTICEICGKSLVNKTSYRNHKMLFHGDPQNQPGPVTCQKCKRILKSQKGYQAHWRKFHSADSEERIEEVEVSEGLTSTGGGPPYQCKYCSYSNKLARQVRLHIIRMHVEKHWKCPHCTRSFAREAHLLKHVNVIHFKLEKATCDMCGKTYNSSSLLKNHIKRVHDQNKAFQCDFCLKAFYDRRNLQDHLQMHKPEEERKWKFKCDQCDKRFRFRNNLEYHMHSHTGNRDHVCTACGMSFKTKWILDKHRLVHTEQRPCVCHICGKSFKMEKYLSVHMLSHDSEKFLCRACGKVFPSENSLGRHRCRAVVGETVTSLRDVLPFDLVGVVQNMPDATHLVIRHGDEEEEVEEGVLKGGVKVEQDTEEVNFELVTLETNPSQNEHDEVKVETIQKEIAGVGMNDHGEVVINFSTEDDIDGEANGVATVISDEVCDTQVAMYMCGICNSFFRTSEDVQLHLEDHVKDGTLAHEELTMETEELTESEIHMEVAGGDEKSEHLVLLTEAETD